MVASLTRASGGIEGFRSNFEGPPAEWLRQLRPMTASVVVKKPEQPVIAALQSLADRILAEGIAAQPSEGEARAARMLLPLIERPALYVSNGTFSVVGTQWECLENGRREIERAISAVGRIERPLYEQQIELGTGFLIAPNLVVTNRHVLENFATLSDREWFVEPSLRARIDFNEERGATSDRQHKIERVVYAASDPNVDLAVVAIAELSDSSEPQPKPIQLAGPSRPRKNRVIAAIGYPEGTSGGVTPLERAMLGGVYGVKRIQPGLVLSSSALTFTHDCTTVAGSSGSCIVAGGGGGALGLHYGGLDTDEQLENFALAIGPLFGGSAEGAMAYIGYG